MLRHALKLAYNIEREGYLAREIIIKFHTFV